MVEVEPDGRLLACHQFEFARTVAEDGGATHPSITEQFAKMTALPGCPQCWCAPIVELATIFSLQPSAIYGALLRFFE